MTFLGYGAGRFNLYCTAPPASAYRNRGISCPAGGRRNCPLRKRRHTWGPGHTPAGQAPFVRGTFEAFRSQRDALLGVFFYRWEDQEACWQCGSPDCPIETAWGLVDREGKPKASLTAFREGVDRLVG